MTYQQLFERLYKAYKEASDNYLKKDAELGQLNGFGNVGDLSEYADLKIKWQLASNDYWGFLASIKGKKINPNAPLGL